MIRSTQTMRVAVLGFAITALAWSGCGGSDSGATGGSAAGGNEAGNSSGGSAGEAGAAGTSNGITSCGSFEGSPKQCIAGQYCSDETLSICDSGCLSNTNCTADQQCDKSSGGNVGVCQNVASKDCTAFVAKCKSCNPAANDAQCNTQCEQVSAACAACAVSANCSDVDMTCATPCGLSG